MDDAWINLIVQNCTRLMAQLNQKTNLNSRQGILGSKTMQPNSNGNSVRHHSGGQSHRPPQLPHLSPKQPPFFSSTIPSAQHSNNVQLNTARIHSYHNSEDSLLDPSLTSTSDSSSSSSLQYLWNGSMTSRAILPASSSASHSSKSEPSPGINSFLQDGNKLSTLIMQHQQQQQELANRYYYDENGNAQLHEPMAAHHQDHILQSHSESARNALIYVAVILAIYLMAVACIAIQYYRKHSTLNPFNSYLCRRSNNARDYYRSSISSGQQAANTARRKRRSSSIVNTANQSLNVGNNTGSSQLQQYSDQSFNPAIFPNTPSSSCVQNGASFDSGQTNVVGGGTGISSGVEDSGESGTDGVGIDAIVSCCATIVKHKSSVDHSRQSTKKSDPITKSSIAQSSTSNKQHQTIQNSEDGEEPKHVNIRINIESAANSDDIITQIDDEDDEEFSPDEEELEDDDDEDEDLNADEEDDEGYEFEESDEIPVLEIDIEKNCSNSPNIQQTSALKTSGTKPETAGTLSLLSTKRNQLKRLFTHFSTSSSTSSNSSVAGSNLSGRTKLPTSAQMSLPLTSELIDPIGTQIQQSQQPKQQSHQPESTKLIARSVSFQTPDLRQQQQQQQCQAELVPTATNNNSCNINRAYQQSSVTFNVNNNNSIPSTTTASTTSGLSGDLTSASATPGTGPMALFKAMPRVYEETHL